MICASFLQYNSKETQHVYGGTGLGLSITSKLVHRLGGTISLDSELGKYADFTVDLPMNGTYVDVEKISNSLKNTTVILMEPKQTDHYSSMAFPIRKESLALDPAVIEVFGLNVIRCNTLDELNGKICVEKDEKARRHFVLMVQETLYEFCSSEKLDSILGQSQYALMTFGPNFLVEKTKASHFKSLTGLFPATLLESILKQISEQKHGKIITSINSKISDFPATNGLFSSLTTGTNILPTPITPNTMKKSIRKDDLVIPHLSSKDKTVSTPSKTPALNPNRRTKDHDFKVLYAEDNIVNQKVLSRVLNRSGITDITIVDNGKKAVDISATIKYDCILLDMQMPVMDGMEACKLIMERDPDSKIVFVAAHALDEFKDKAKSAGAKGFISKPFRVGDIDDVLKDIF